jgi:phosphatidylserine/phosphatidylglycerophosphate/cardiolipin synthase-like enzyme
MCASKARSGMLHAKTMAVDGIWGTVGSANLDNRSLALNDEMNLVAHDREFVAHLEKVFGDDLAHSRLINPQRWRTRACGNDSGSRLRCRSVVSSNKMHAPWARPVAPKPPARSRS